MRGGFCAFETYSEFYLTVWSIVAVRAFRDPDSCDQSAIDKFPPNQQIPLHVVVFDRLVGIWDTEQGANLLYGSDTVMTKDERLTQLVDGMHGVVMELA